MKDFGFYVSSLDSGMFSLQKYLDRIAPDFSFCLLANIVDSSHDSVVTLEGILTASLTSAVLVENSSLTLKHLRPSGQLLCMDYFYRNRQPHLLHQFPRLTERYMDFSHNQSKPDMRQPKHRLQHRIGR